MKPVAALVAIVVLLFTGPLTGAALGQPSHQPTGDATGPLSLVLDELAPRVVTADGPVVLTVTGTLTNTGDTPVGEIGVRLQRGQPLTTEGAVRDALAGDAPTDAIVPQFQELPDVLGVGEQVPIRLTVSLRGAPETGLALSAPGVYELLVNVNGVPDGGDRARLAAVRTMLPVIGLPPGPDGSDAVPDTAAPGLGAAPVTLLYPVVDQPRRLSTVPGETTLLTDDTLADSLAPDGRLGGLVAALSESAPVGSAVRDATCVVVDPDLVQTASAMGAGYQVLDAGGGRVPGRGADVASAWLASFAAAARGGCVLALPFADTDVVALTRGGLGDIAVDAVTRGREIVAELLGTPVLPSTAWPADGLVDEPTLGTLADAGVRSVVLSADGLDRPAGADPAGVVPIAGGPATVGVIADPLLTLAAGGTVAERVVAETSGAAAGARTAGGALATQDLLGALAFRVTRDVPDTGPVVVAPPHRWAADGPAARALLDGIDRLVAAGLVGPRSLGDVVTGGAPADVDAAALVYPLSAGAREIPGTTVASIGEVLDGIADLASSVVDDDLGVDPDDVFDPLLTGAVRPASTAWRGAPQQSAASAVAGAERLADIRGTVTVLEPPSPFSLATSDSPLLLTVSNGLPVTMSVRVELASTAGLRVAPIPIVEVPPLGRRQIQASAEVLRSGVFTVDAAVLTRDGGRLGPPSRLEVRSTVYGTITLWLTGTAAVLLVVLAGRRILRRIRTEPDRHPASAPRPGVPESIPDTAPTPRIPLPDGSGPSSGPTRAGPPTGRNRPVPSEPRIAGGPPVRYPLPVPPGRRPPAGPAYRAVPGTAHPPPGARTPGPRPPVRPPGQEPGPR
ncbi:DUF6049 family protein [Pseudonocardia sp.]|uniref:DUF6049 family protein n=1 Tax=Pseudonocardia sp. TaxID=60912 RepID=UPI00260AEFB0|nr:DUF6049 family protein [Pseudonocardia sp.]